MFNKCEDTIQKNDKKRLLSNFFSLSILHVFTYTLPLLTLPYLVSVLGIEKFGLLMFSQSFILFFNILVDYGFNLSATREIAIHRDDKKKVTEIFSAVMTLKIFFLIVAFIILNLIIVSFDKFLIDWELYNLTFLMVLGTALFPVWYFQGMENMKYITVINVVSKLIFTILIFLLIEEESDYIYVPILNGLGLIVAAILSLTIIYSKFKQSIHWYSFTVLKGYFIDSSNFFLSRVSVTIYTASNVFILGLFTNNLIVGYYSIAEKLYKALLGIYQPVVQVLYPYISKEKNIRLFKKLFFTINIVNIMGIIILYFAAEYFFTLLFAQSIGLESLEIFHILLWSVLVIVPSMLLGYPFLGALGFSNYANLSIVYSSIFHLIGLVVLMLLNMISIYTVALMLVFTELLVFTLRIYWIKRNKLWGKQ